MGTAVAVLCAARGYQVVLTDVEASVLQSFPHRAIPVARAITTSAEAVIETVRCDPVLETSVEGATLVHEVIHEDLEAKRTLFRRLDKLCGPEVMLATNTSSFMLSEMVSDLQGRDRVVGIHYVAPAHLIRAVEIITADFTRPELVARARAFVDSIDHVGVVCRERPGFLVNRIQYAMKAEIQRILESGIASVEDIDAAVRLAIGPRLALWGPLMQEDLAASKKTVVSVGDYLHQSTGEPHFAPTATLRRLVENGHTGAAAGRGWYRWGENYAALVGERDRQLAALLSWLRQNDRLAELGATGENPLVQEPGGPGSA
jgi:3-hydroxybutyryl-CoA dehydrogenase